MDNFFKTETYVTATLTDTNFMLSPHGVLALMQDAQTLHTDEMKVDSASLRRDSGAFWVIARTRFHVFSTPKWKDLITVNTYPMKPKLLRSERQNYITGADGELLIAGKSEWCILDAKTRTLRKFSSLSYYPDIEHRADRVYDGEFIREKVNFAPENLAYSREIRYSDLDFNHHVNNVHYANLIADCLKSSEWENMTITDYEIDYLKEIGEGEKLDVYCRRDGNKYSFLGKSGENEIFRAEVLISSK